MATQKKKYSLADRLAMQNTSSMEVGSIYHINKVEDPIEFTDSKTGEIRSAVVVDCDDGQYYLPNTIANAYIEESAENPFAAREALEGKTFKCVSFRAKKYSKTPWHLVEQITSVDEWGNIVIHSRGEE